MKKLIFITALFSLMASCGNNKNSKPEKATETITASEKTISAQIEADPTNPELYYRRSIVYLDEKYLEKAIADIDAAIALAADNPLYLYTKARILYAMNRTIDAAKFYEQTLAAKPDFEDAQLKLAELYLMVKEHQKAKNLLNTVLAKNPQNANAYFLKGMNLKELGDTAGAVQAFQKAYETDDKYYNAVMQLGILYAALKNKIALDYYVAAARLNPKNAEPPFNSGVFFQQQGDFKKAIKMYEQALKADPRFYLAYYNAGIIAAQSAKYKHAIDNFNQTIRVEAGYTDAYYMRGVCYEAINNKEDAIINYEYALELQPNHQQAKAALKNLRK